MRWKIWHLVLLLLMLEKEKVIIYFKTEILLSPATVLVSSGARESIIGRGSNMLRRRFSSFLYFSKCASGFLWFFAYVCFQKIKENHFSPVKHWVNNLKVSGKIFFLRSGSSFLSFSFQFFIFVFFFFFEFEEFGIKKWLKCLVGHPQRVSFKKN